MLKQSMKTHQQRNEYEENDENCDETVASVKLNDSDIKQLDNYNFNFSEDDDDDDDDANNLAANDKENTPTNAAATKQKTHLVSNNSDFRLLSSQRRNDEFLHQFSMFSQENGGDMNLLNESVDILRVSDPKADSESEMRQFNYDKFDKVNESSNSSSGSSDQAIFKVPEIRVTEYPDRVDELVRQSVERTKKQKSDLIANESALSSVGIVNSFRSPSQAWVGQILKLDF